MYTYIETIFRTYATQKGAEKYAAKMFKDHGLVLSIQQAGNTYLVGA